MSMFAALRHQNEVLLSDAGFKNHIKTIFLELSFLHAGCVPAENLASLQMTMVKIHLESGVPG